MVNMEGLRSDYQSPSPITGIFYGIIAIGLGFLLATRVIGIVLIVGGSLMVLMGVLSALAILTPKIIKILIFIMLVGFAAGAVTALFSSDWYIGLILLMIEISLIVLFVKAKEKLLKFFKFRTVTSSPPPNMVKISETTPARRCFSCGIVFEVSSIFGNPPCPECKERINLSKTLPGDKRDKIGDNYNICLNCSSQLDQKDLICSSCNNKIDFKEQLLKSMENQGLKY